MIRMAVVALVAVLGSLVASPAAAERFGYYPEEDFSDVAWRVQYGPGSSQFFVLGMTYPYRMADPRGTHTFSFMPWDRHNPYVWRVPLFWDSHCGYCLGYGRFTIGPDYSLRDWRFTFVENLLYVGATYTFWSKPGPGGVYGMLDDRDAELPRVAYFYFRPRVTLLGGANMAPPDVAPVPLPGAGAGLLLAMALLGAARLRPWRRTRRPV